MLDKEQDPKGFTYFGVRDLQTCVSEVKVKRSLLIDANTGQVTSQSEDLLCYLCAIKRDTGQPTHMNTKCILNIHVPYESEIEEIYHLPDNPCSATFEWGYQGSGPASLAQAILYDFSKSEGVTATYAQELKRKIISEFKDNKNFWVTGVRIDSWMRNNALYCERCEKTTGIEAYQSSEDVEVILCQDCAGHAEAGAWDAYERWQEEEQNEEII